MTTFYEKVTKGLSLCGVNLSSLSKSNGVIGIAVSGGADSIALLHSLSYILLPWNIPIQVITVNHFIRPVEETSGDAQYVYNTCKQMKENGLPISCTVVELKKGEVVELAKKHKAGIEEAARYLRYKAFENFIKEKNISYLCLAHNKNDQVETLLMRFLQGSNSDSSVGIKIKREKYIRPLLNISRQEIEEFLIELNVSWCEDKTNNDTTYYRNNVRHNLIPFLYENFPGFDKAIFKGANKAKEDSEIINELVERFPLKIKENSVLINKNDFLKEHKGIQKRILFKACNICGETKRIPDLFLNDVINSLNTSDKDLSKFYDEVEIENKKDILFVKKYTKKDTDLVFFDIIEDNGTYLFPFGKLTVTFDHGHMFASINGCEVVLKCTYPIVVRSFRQGDEIRNSEGNMKKLSDIFSDWHVDVLERKLIPVVYNVNEGSSEIKGILASFLGYKDWIVK